MDDTTTPAAQGTTVPATVPTQRPQAPTAAGVRALQRRVMAYAATGVTGKAPMSYHR